MPISNGVVVVVAASVGVAAAPVEVEAVVAVVVGLLALVVAPPPTDAARGLPAEAMEGLGGARRAHRCPNPRTAVRCKAESVEGVEIMLFGYASGRRGEERRLDDDRDLYYLVTLQKQNGPAVRARARVLYMSGLDDADPRGPQLLYSNPTLRMARHGMTWLVRATCLASGMTERLSMLTHSDTHSVTRLSLCSTVSSVRPPASPLRHCPKLKT